MISISESHGHVRPRPDGSKARCGGPGICSQCMKEKLDFEREATMTQAVLQTQQTEQEALIAAAMRKARLEAAAELASRFDEPMNAWSAGWLSAAAYLAGSEQFSLDAQSTDIAWPTENAPVTMPEPNAHTPFCDGSCKKGTYPCPTRG